MNYAYVLSTAAVGVVSLVGYLYKNHGQLAETKPIEKKVEWKLKVTPVYDSLVRLDFQANEGSMKNSEEPFLVELFDGNNTKLVQVYKTSTILLSTNETGKFKEAVHAIITDEHGKQFKTNRNVIEMEKKKSLLSKTNLLKETFLQLLKKEKKFRFLMCGGCGEGKSTQLKSIFDLVESLGFVLKDGKREMIKCYKTTNSVTLTVFSLKLTKEIDGNLVEIEIIDCPGLWNDEKEPVSKTIVSNQIKYSKKVLGRILSGQLRNGIDIEKYKGELFESTLPVSNPIPKPDIILFCTKHAKITSSEFAQKRFRKLNEFNWNENVPSVLVGTALDDGDSYLCPGLRKDLAQCKSFVLKADGQSFEEVDPRECDVFYSNYSIPIKKETNLQVYLVPIVNYCETNLSFLDEVPSRKELSDFLLYQLLVHSLKSKRSAN